MGFIEIDFNKKRKWQNFPRRRWTKEKPTRKDWRHNFSSSVTGRSQTAKEAARRKLRRSSEVYNGGMANKYTSSYHWDIINW
jgi:hypothetical protein